MAVFKCKMCGGDLSVEEGTVIAECGYCGTKQTVPSQDSEKKLSLFARAERLRRSNEFDKAVGVYESIVSEFPEEAEAYWGLVLCKYGIEYVDDPGSGKKIPTCHRSSFDSVLEDTDFEQACENADPIARKLYREEAKAIEELRRGIIEISGKEEPYDIFICYKETDEAGERTVDSVMAQEVYDALAEKGYRVFFSRISLEDKLGMQYEPYIFAALNSAKVMLVFGSDYEYFNAVWVKNEWSRFLALIAAGQKKTLIPCYKGIDAYDMPKEFAHLQAQDMGKVGAVQDLLRGIDKLLSSEQKETERQSASAPQGGVSAESLIKRGNLFLEEGNWKSAAEYFDKALDIDPENGGAYIGKFCVEMRYRKLSDMAEDISRWDGEAQPEDNADYAKALRFGSAELKSELERLKIAVKENIIADAEHRKQIIPILKEKRDKLKLVSGMIAVCDDFTVGLCSDGTVVATGNNAYGQCNVSSWKGIVAVACSDNHTVGLRLDGTVVATGNNRFGQCNVSSWQDIVAVACDSSYTVGLRSDGTVVVATFDESEQHNASRWQDIVAVAANGHTVGLRSNGTVVAAGSDNEFGECNVSGWKNIAAIYVDYQCTAGIQTDGRVVSTIENSWQSKKIASWQNIVALALDSYLSVMGLKADGTVSSDGEGNDDQLIKNWRNIIAIYNLGYCYVGLCANGTVVSTYEEIFPGCKDIVTIVSNGSQIAGIRSDGTVIATGDNDHGQCNTQGWKLFDNIDTLEQERAEAKAKAEQERAEAERKRQEAERQQIEAERRRLEEEHRKLEAERTALQEELANLKGLFSGRRRREIEARLAEIERQLK